MAKRKRRLATTDYLAQFGYPSDKELRREAAALAQASLPSPKAVAQPYNRQLQSARDFLAAVQSALATTSGDIGKTYDAAQASSQAVADASQARLASLGLGQYAAGTQAAAGARSDSAAQNLIAQGASARDYAARQPGIAAGLSNLEALGIGQKKTDALANRQDSLRQAFGQALQSVQGQHLAMAQFNQGQSQFAQQMSLQREQMAQTGALAVEDRKFRAQQAELDRRATRQSMHDQLLAQYGYDNSTGSFVNGTDTSSVQGIASKYGLTPNEVINLTKHTADQVENLLVKQGMGFRDATKRALANGVPPEVVRMAVARIYDNPPNPPTPVWQNDNRMRIGKQTFAKGSLISDQPPPNPNTYKNGAQDGQYVRDLEVFKTYAQNFTGHYLSFLRSVNDFHKFQLSNRFQPWLAGVAPPKPPPPPPHHGR